VPTGGRSARPGDAALGRLRGLGHLADGRQASGLTAGLDNDHDVLPEYGIDDLGPGHRVNPDPGVVRIREAASLLGISAGLMVTTPADFEGAEGDPAPGEDAISQWTTVAARREELTWVIDALAMNSVGAEDVDDDLD
jgi:hypothetical protein